LASSQVPRTPVGTFSFIYLFFCDKTISKVENAMEINLTCIFYSVTAKVIFALGHHNPQQVNFMEKHLW
jgi:hypothetical protein